MCKKLIKEMARIGVFGQYKVEVYEDHNPPHFHFTKKDCFEVTMTIEDLDIVHYKWQKDKKGITRKDIDKLVEFLESPSIRTPKMTNYERLWDFWESMNPSDDF